MAVRQQKIVLISTSALILAFSYVIASLWWGIFIFLVPLYFCVLKYPVNPIKDGLLWGTLFWTIQYYGIINVLYEKAEGEWRLLAGLLLIVYSTLYVMLWFWAATKTAQLYNNTYWLLLCWAIATFAYFYWVRYYMFFIFTQNIGYPFGYPTLLLAQCPQTLRLLAIFGSHVFLLLIIASNGLAAQALYYSSYKSFLLATMLLVPFGAGFVYKPKYKKPACLNQLGYLSPPNTNDAGECADIINEKITELIIRQPTVRTVMMPESAYPYYLNQHPRVLELWGSNALFNGLRLLIGAYRMDEQGKGYNSCYNIQEGRIISFYDKSLQFPFVEYHPLPYLSIVKGLFLKNKREFSARKGTAHPFVLTDNLTLLPMLCSDLFFDLTINNKYTYPLLCAVNDNWFSISYMRNLMFLFATYKSMELNRDIVYISHTKGMWLSPSTESWHLLC